MAFQTGSSTDLADLIADLSTFLTANGWTEDERDNTGGDFAFSKNSIFVSGRWDTTSPSIISLHQATAFVSTATLPGDHTGDSGNGYNTSSSHTNANLDGERHVDLASDGPYAYWFFEQDSGPAYIHIVVEISTDVFVHFGFGEINKIGNWVGGEYLYGNRHTGSSELLTTSTWLFDGHFQSITSTDEQMAATIRLASGLPNQGTAVWGQIWGRNANIPNDTAGNPKALVVGGFRSSLVAVPFGLFSGSKTTGHIPMYSIPATYWDQGSNHVYALGFLPDVRGINIRNFAPADIVTIGGEQWYIFPAKLRDTATVTNATGFSGIAYRREDA